LANLFSTRAAFLAAFSALRSSLSLFASFRAALSAVSASFEVEVDEEGRETRTSPTGTALLRFFVSVSLGWISV